MRNYCVHKLYSETLNRLVRLFISLPENYYDTNKSYLVVYMNDGQSLFDTIYHSFGNGWSLNEQLAKQNTKHDVILVGIEAGVNRSAEYNAFPFTWYGEPVDGKVWEYLDYVVKDIIPYVNNNFRTIQERSHTTFIGSSFGGVCATYAAMYYSEYFGRFGCISNAYFPTIDKFEPLLQKETFEQVEKIYMDVGTNESPEDGFVDKYLQSNKIVFSILNKKLNSSRIRTRIIDEGRHLDEDWGARFVEILNYLLEDIK